MKTLHLLLLMLLPALMTPAVAQKKSKEDKTVIQEEAFQKTKQLIESKNFTIKIDQVYPQNGMDVSRFTPRGEFTVRDSIAEGRLPFFGRAYKLPYGESGGIEFNSAVKEEHFKIIEKKRKKSILYQFVVSGKDDIYDITIESAGGDGCSVRLSSNNRAHISYSGTISSIEENKE